MKASSVSGNLLKSGLTAEHQRKSLLDAMQTCCATLVNIANQIGTAIALGEHGDLDAAHEYRSQKTGVCK